jgi:hypothetical protein
VTGRDGPVLPAACAGKTTFAGPFTTTIVPSPDKLTVAGDVPLYETDSWPEAGTGVCGSN